MAGVGVPIKILHEALGLTLSIELKTGQLYRGKAVNVEDNMNIQLSQVTLTGRDGRLSVLEHCFIRGSQIKFIIIPDNLRHAPLFKNFSSKEKRGHGLGMGKARAEVARAQACKK